MPFQFKVEPLKKQDDMGAVYFLDDTKKGKFNSKDISEYNDAEFNMLFGRRWNDYPKYKNPVAIQRDDENVELAIWSANK